MNMRALSVSDLHVIDDEPRIRDLELAERLGFERPTSIRVLIRRHRGEIELHGSLHQSDAMIEAGKGARRLVTEYWLNEGQALGVCILARTPKAVAVRHQVIQVNLAWRHGRLAPPAASPPALPPAPYDPIATALQLMSGRLLAADLLGRTEEETDAARIVARLNRLDIWSQGRPGRRPRWFHAAPPELVVAVYATWRKHTLEVVQAGLAREFGPLAPSRSALHRFWQRLDGLKHKGLDR